MNLYVIRHGETDWNKNFILQGTSDIPLNNTGIEQARNASSKLCNINFKHVYTSPLTRTKQTLAELAINCNSVSEDYRIIERDFGDLDGTQANTKPYWDYALNLSTNNVEPIKKLCDRVKDFITYIIDEYGSMDCNILLVTHNRCANGTQFSINRFPYRW